MATLVLGGPTCKLFDDGCRDADLKWKALASIRSFGYTAITGRWVWDPSTYSSVKPDILVIHKGQIVLLVELRTVGRGEKESRRRKIQRAQYERAADNLGADLLIVHGGEQAKNCGSYVHARMEMLGRIA